MSNVDKLSSDELARYSRHILLPKVGVEGQQKLKSSKVLIIGMGGLGSPVALYLTAAGFGTIGLADFDKVEKHNLQRQIIHTTEKEGTPKIDSAIERMNALNPHCSIKTHKEGITVDNAIEIFEQYDLIVDGSDNFPTRYLVNDAAFFAKKPLVYGSIFQFEGQVSFFNPHDDGPCYRCLFPVPPAPGTVPNCSEAGVFGALCGTIGSLQSMEALKYVLGIGDLLKGKLLVIDSLDMAFRKLNLKKDSSCPLCGDNPEITEIRAETYAFSCQIEPESKAPESVAESECPIEISILETNELLNTDESVYLLDVREPFEVDICKIDKSINIPMNTIPERLDALPKDRQILVYCHHGMRSMNVVNFLRSKGIENTTNIQGGINLWAETIDSAMERY